MAMQVDPHGDQPLVKTTAPEVRARSEELRSQIESEPAHSDELDARAGRKVQEIDQRLAEQAAASVVNRESQPDVPPDTSQAALREGGDMSEVVLSDPGVDRVERTFSDLFTDFPIGQGQFYVQVVRIAPTVWDGKPTRGELRPIWAPLTWEEFIDEYGGTKYELTVYGPRRALRRDKKREEEDPNAPPRRHTKPITVYVPGNIAPNPGAAATEGDPMTDVGPRRLGLASNADARMHETEIAAREREEARREQREREREQRQAERVATARREEQSKAADVVGVLQQQLAAANDDMREMRRMVDKMRDEQATARAQVVETAANSKANELKGLAEVFKATGGDTDKYQAELKLLTDTHVAEMNRLRDAHAGELSRLRDEQAKELRRVDETLMQERTAAQQRIKDIEERERQHVKDVETRTAAQLKEMEDRAAARIREIEARAEKELASVKTDNDRRVQDLKDQHTARIQDIERLQKRDEKSSEERARMQGDSQKSIMDTQIAIKEQEISRLRGELEEARAEARKPLAERVNELAEAAEALGYEKAGGGEEPKDWKQTALEVGGNLLGNLPDILRSAGEAVGRARGGPNAAQMAAYSQAQMQAPPRALPPPLRGAHGALQRPRGFATDDGPEFEGPRGSGAVIIPPGMQQQLPQSAPVPPPQPPMQQMTLPMVAPSAPPPAVQEAQPVPAAAPEQPSVPPPAAEPSGAAPTVTDAQVLMFAPLFEQALTQGATPDQLAQYCVETYGASNVQMLLGSVGPERVLQALQAGGKETSPLCRRDGQKFLRETYSQLQKQLA